MLAVTLILAYAIGALPTGLLIGRVLGTGDLRDHGSSSSGATNVLRLKGWPAGILVALLDISKGWLAVALIPRIAGEDSLTGVPWIPLAAGFAAVLGHVWPIAAGFRGGKGVATTAGAVLAVSPPAFAGSVLVFVLIVAAARRVSVGSLTSAACLPLLLYAFGRGAGGIQLVFGLVSFGLIVFTHRVNVGNLIAGTEPTIGK